MTEDVVEKGKKIEFLVVVLGKHKGGMVIGNPAVAWTTLEDPGGYNESIHAKDFLFDQSNGKKKHAGKEIEYEKFLVVKESI